jgi:hypothetical protein
MATDQAHNVVCVGYQRLQNPAQFGLRQTPDELHPFCDKVTNAERPDGTWSDQAQDRFYDILYWLQDFGSGFLTWSGADLRTYEKTRITRLVRRCLGKAQEPEPVARLLARQIREVHERQERENPRLITVGKSVMCAILRRPDMSRTGPVQIMINRISTEAETLSENDLEASLFARSEGDTPQRFIYYPGDRPQRTYYLPNAVTEYTVQKGGMLTW